MACWTCKGPDVPRLIAEWGEDGYFGAKWAKVDQKLSTRSVVLTVTIRPLKTLLKANRIRIARPHVLRALDHLNNALQAKAKS